MDGSDTSGAAGCAEQLGLGARPRHPTDASPRLLPGGGSCSFTHSITMEKNPGKQLEIPAPNATAPCFPNSFSSLCLLHPQLPSSARCQPRDRCQGQAKITTSQARVSYVKVTGGFVRGRSPKALPWLPPALPAVRRAEEQPALDLWLRQQGPCGGAGRAQGSCWLWGERGKPRRLDQRAFPTRQSLPSFPTETPSFHQPWKMSPPSLGACTVERTGRAGCKAPKGASKAPCGAALASRHRSSALRLRGAWR